MAKIIKKETIQRLVRDVKDIIQNPLIDNGIYYIHDDTDMLRGYALIIGPENTPYFGGNYFFELTYPQDYPHSPPKVKYCTNGKQVRFNPNLYACGKVCISLLNTWRGDQWTSCQSISSVLLALCTLLCKDPILNEPGVTEENVDRVNYNDIVEYANLDISICDILNKKHNVYLEFFEYFDSFVRENYLKNKNKIMEFAIQKNEERNKEIRYLKTSLYNMNIAVDYNEVIEKLTQIDISAINK
jgi:ubiquitin-conjugating enzyme E2 Z